MKRNCHVKGTRLPIDSPCPTYWMTLGKTTSRTRNHRLRSIVIILFRRSSTWRTDGTGLKISISISNTGDYSESSHQLEQKPSFITRWFARWRHQFTKTCTLQLNTDICQIILILYDYCVLYKFAKQLYLLIHISLLINI